jgi:hypothetical protein
VARVKKSKQPGDNISLKTKKTEDPSVMNWINAQTNLMDSLRYLIEHEVLQNGVRNLQTFIPVERNVWGSVQSIQREDPEQPNLSMHPKETKPSEAFARSTIERNTDDEIDDEDIESWV